MESDITNFIAFFRQLGLAAAGAASLWGFVFLSRSRITDNDVSRIIFRWIARRLLWLMYGGIIVAVGAWLVLASTMSVSAHEGITLYPSALEAIAALAVTAPGYLLLVVLSLVGVLLQWLRPVIFSRIAPAYFLTQFIVLVFLASLSSAWTGELSSAKVFFALHGFHSILTLGTVLVLDFLFLSAKSSHMLQRHIFPLFPWISTIIWIGLGLDFLSVAFIFDDAFMFTSRFFFSQTVIGILIINGVMLAGPITRRILASLERGYESMERKWLMIADVAGTVSIISWSSITFVDFFPEIHLSYSSMIAIYVSVIVVAFTGHYFWERFDTEEPDTSQMLHS